MKRAYILNWSASRHIDSGKKFLQLRSLETDKVIDSGPSYPKLVKSAGKEGYSIVWDYNEVARVRSELGHTNKRTIND